MKANELRIGNLITTIKGTKHYKEVLRVETTTINNFDIDGSLCAINGYYESEVIPIPLTEEWLLKFGFERMDWWGDLIFWRKRDIDIQEIDEGFINDYDRLIHSVHQLQNLYFALTNSELELND